MKHPVLLSFALATFTTLPTGAAVVYSGVQNLPVTFDLTGLYLNPATGSTSPNENSDPTINLFFGGVAIGTNSQLRPEVVSGDQLDNLELGMVVDGSVTYAAGVNGSSTHTGPAANQFQIGTPGYLGFAMQTTIGGPTEYGWMQIVINNAGPGNVVDWAYENTAGVPISVGVVPEVSDATLASLGAACLILRRRRS